MADPFLEETKVADERTAMQEAIKSALQQRQNTVYSRTEVGDERDVFRGQLRKLMRDNARQYTQPVSDAGHYAVIRGIADTLSAKFGHILTGRRFRYGTAQKAFNLYLKFLWRLGQITTPPHCPVDGIVLTHAGIDARWTHSDSEAEYVGWIKTLKQRAHPLSLSEWEYRLWSAKPKSKSASCS
jgi:hypothetical protein